MIAPARARVRVFISAKSDDYDYAADYRREQRGNLVTVVVGALQPAALPPSLRYYEVIPFERRSLDKLLRYVQQPGCSADDPDTLWEEG